MPTDDRIQPPAGNTPAPAQTAVTTAPSAPAPAAVHAGPAVPNPLAVRLAEIWEYVKPHLTPRLGYVVLGIVLLVAGYFLIDHFFFDKKPNSKLWAESLMLNSTSDVRKAADEVQKAAEKDGKQNPPDRLGDQEYRSSLVYRQLLEDFAKTCPDTIQERVTRIQLGRYLYNVALRDLMPPDPRNPSHSAEILESVRDSCAKLEPQLSSEPVLQEEVMLIRAQALETLGDVKEAEDLYRKLADSEKSKNGAAGKEAAASIKRLSDPKNKQEVIDLAKRYVRKAS